MIRAARQGVGFRLRELLDYRELVGNLTLRDIKLKYKRSLLGVAWSLLNPVITMAIYTVVFSLFLRIVTLPNYWALVLSGILVWTFFSSSLISATSSLVNGSGLVTKLYFPIESLTISTVLAQFVNFLASVVILVVVLLVARIPIGPSIVLLPVAILATLAMAIGCGFFLAAVSVYFRDLEHLVPLALASLFYLTPVIYPLDTRALPRAAAQYIPYLRLNPMTWFLETYHSILYYGTWPDPKLFTLMLVAAAIALVGGYAVFLRLRPRVPEEL